MTFCEKQQFNFVQSDRGNTNFDNIFINQKTKVLKSTDIYNSILTLTIYFHRHTKQDYLFNTISSRH